MLKVLIIDDEEDIRDIIAFTFEAEADCEFLFADTGNKAIEVIESAKEIDLIVCDYNMPRGNGGMVYEYLLDRNLMIPYVLCSSSLPQEYEVFSSGKQLIGNIEKPNVFEGVQEVLKNLEEKKNLFSGGVVEKNNSTYCNISIDLLESMKEMPTDIFVKINEEKFVKVLKMHDILSIEEVLKYKDKKIDKLLIQKTDLKIVVETLSQQIEMILTGIDTKEETKIIDAHNVIMKTVKNFGFSEKIVRVTENSVKVALETFQKVKKFDTVYNRIFRNERSYLTKHSVALSYVSCGIISKLAWDSMENRNKLVMSSFLHDVTIKVPVLDEEVLTEREMENFINFKDHPAEAVELIKKYKNIPADVDQIILDHHEKPDGSGLPRGLTANQLKPLASMFIFSHDVVEAIFKIESENLAFTTQNVISKLDKEYYSAGNFKKCYEALEQLELFK